MTSEIDVLKTNELLRRRKLRILQVREQSKDIAKKIRQRASVEKLRHIVNLDAKKEKEYLAKQEKLVEELEKQYANSLKKIGSGHRKASSFKEQGPDTEKRDLSKERGKVAAAQIREQKQKYLNDKKKILDRKLQAREVANELSREKGVTVANKIKTLQKSDPTSNEEEAITVDKNTDDKLNDMATQCDIVPNDQVECNIPSMENEKAVRDQTTNECLNKVTRRHNLFAISDEMPTSLRGSNLNYMVHTEDTFKPSNVISDYLQNRDMRLRQTEPASNKSSDDLQKIKHTILQTRAAMKTQQGNICDVLDNDMIPVPSWHAEHTNQYHISSNNIADDLYLNIKEKKTANQIKNTSCSRRTSPIPRSRIAQTQSGKSSEHNKSLKQTSKGSFAKRNTLTTYNHSSRDERNVFNDGGDVVVRDLQVEEDAYSQAIKENSIQTTEFIENHKRKIQDMHHKVAVTKQKVEQEYEDTMKFLKTLPRETVPKSIRKAYMSNHRQQQQKEDQQKILQQEFKNITKGCRKHVTVSSCPNKLRSNVMHSCIIDTDEEIANIDNTAERSKPTLYSWVPVPESDHSLTVHKIPNSKRDTPNVKFDDENSYHEYRSRHKHTPPTKDKSNNEINKSSMKGQSKDSEPIDNQSISSNSESNEKSQEESSITRLRETINAISDQDKIIIYKILDNDKALDEEDIKDSKFTKDVFTSLTSIDKKIREALKDKKPCHKKSKCHRKKQPELNEQSEYSVEQLTEGVYKTVKEKGSNITSLYYNDSDENKQSKGEEPDKICECSHSKKEKHKMHREESTDWKMQGDSEAQNRCNRNMEKCSTCGLKEPASSESTSSFKSAQMAMDHHEQKLKEHVKVADPTCKDAGNFYIGASGYLKDAYEVIIQLRKKENNGKNDEADNISNNKIQKSTLPDVQSTEGVNEILISDDVSTTKVIDNALIDAFHTGKLKGPDEENKKCQEKDNSIKSLYKHTTTAYTQTSMYNSPKQNPIYYHMSSSTSTTYMSPPENILPSFLKHRQVVQHENDEPQPEKESKFYRKHTVAESDSSSEHIRSLEDFKKKPKFKKNKHKSHKCKKKGQTVVSKKVPSRCGISNKNTTITAEVINNLLRKASNQKNRHPSLNPIIKNYVDEVLQLSKDGMKAVEVATQNCSSATTPGSSIVNIPSNIETGKCPKLMTTISIEQIVRILEDNFIHTVNSGQRLTTKGYIPNDKENHQKVNIRKKTRHPKIKHRIKSLNISKHLMNKSNCKKTPVRQSTSSPQNHTETNTKVSHKNFKTVPSRAKLSKAAYEICSSDEVKSTIQNTENTRQLNYKKKCTTSKHFNSPSSDILDALYSAQNIDVDNQVATDSSTQTNDVIDYENKIIELEENKIQNMEKIANLTEKCTKRLSDLAKVLEEVRKNKSTAYGHISSADSSSDREHKNEIKTSHQYVKNEDSHEFKINEDNKMFNKPNLETDIPSVHVVDNLETKEKVAFVPVLSDLPKPPSFIQFDINTQEQHSLANSARTRCKPPPALSRVSLKCVQEGLIPHELSTVPEIESPLSLKLSSKLSPNSQNHTKVDSLSENESLTERTKRQVNPDILQNNSFKSRNKLSYIDDMNRPKVQMMDLNKFNEMMLKPFVSIEEYAQQCNIGALDEGSNLEDLPKDGTLNDEISSLHSDGSLPDVVSELLKLKIISEPFKYDSISNANSTSISSESSASMLVLSKKKKHHDETKCKKNEKLAVDTSDSLSVSSNHDLENVFKKLGIGWASSTLKKTKERLALSSSTSTSTSSASHRYHMKRQDKYLQNMPVLVNDTLSKDLSGLKSSSEKKHDNSKSSKNVEQQTSLLKSSAVKDFLTNELADKITFTHNSHNDNSDLHFTSLYSTKFPLESENVVENVEDVARPASRQRTSTPVQLYKSMHYDTNSSSYNYSNGLFSNVDDLSSVKVTSSSVKNNSNTDKDELSIPNCSLKVKKDSK